MYSIIIDYPNALYRPTNSISPTTSVIGSRAIEIDRKPLVEMINKIFDGKHDELFGHTELTMGEPESILLTTKPRWGLRRN